MTRLCFKLLITEYLPWVVKLPTSNYESTAAEPTEHQITKPGARHYFSDPVKCDVFCVMCDVQCGSQVIVQHHCQLCHLLLLEYNVSIVLTRPSV